MEERKYMASDNRHRQSRSLRVLARIFQLAILPELPGGMAEADLVHIQQRQHRGHLGRDEIVDTGLSIHQEQQRQAIHQSHRIHRHGLGIKLQDNGSGFRDL